jgi:predicted DsbA family dithiol-disulfide isomerase
VLVEIWSDVACPWCYVGKRRFEQALSRFEHRDEVDLRWRSFELDPEAPAEREGDRATRIAQKLGRTVEEARTMERNLTDTAAADGLEMRFDLARSGSTFDAHRVVHFAYERGQGEPMKERLLRAYFTEGELLSDHATLARLASEVSLPADEVFAMLGSLDYAEAVREDERAAHALGIGAVPTFVIDRALGASGAHPPEQLLELLRRGWAAHDERALAGGPA